MIKKNVWEFEFKRQSMFCYLLMSRQCALFAILVIGMLCIRCLLLLWWLVVLKSSYVHQVSCHSLSSFLASDAFSGISPTIFIQAYPHSSLPSFVRCLQKLSLLNVWSQIMHKIFLCWRCLLLRHTCAYAFVWRASCPCVARESFLNSSLDIAGFSVTI